MGVTELLLHISQRRQISRMKNTSLILCKALHIGQCGNQDHSLQMQKSVCVCVSYLKAWTLLHKESFQAPADFMEFLWNLNNTCEGLVLGSFLKRRPQTIGSALLHSEPLPIGSELQENSSVTARLYLIGGSCGAGADMPSISHACATGVASFK